MMEYVFFDGLASVPMGSPGLRAHLPMHMINDDIAILIARLSLLAHCVFINIAFSDYCEWSWKVVIPPESSRISSGSISVQAHVAELSKKTEKSSCIIWIPIGCWGRPDREIVSFRFVSLVRAVWLTSGIRTQKPALPFSLFPYGAPGFPFSLLGRRAFPLPLV